MMNKPLTPTCRALYAIYLTAVSGCASQYAPPARQPQADWARRWGRRMAVLSMAALFSGLAAAATYTLPGGTLPSGCTSDSSTSVTCSSLSLSWGDNIVVTNANTTLTVTNELKVGGNNINTSSPASGFNIVAKKITSGGSSTFGGSLTATSDDITIGSADKVTGDVSSNNGKVTLNSANVSVGGNVTAKEEVELGSAASVAGNVTSTNGSVILKSSNSSVGGNVTARDKVTLESGTQVGGNVNSTNNDVNLWSSNAKVNQCITVDINKNINLGWHASVSGVCCQSGASCTTDCVNNSSGYATPGICVAAPVTLADYRFDEAAQYTGTSGEVKNTVSGGANGTTFNGVNNSAGKVCKAGNFDGVNQYVVVNGLSDSLSGTASMSFWIKTTQVGNNTMWQAPGVTGIEEDGGGDDVFWGWLDNNGRIGITKGNTTGAKSTDAINDGQWHHIVLTRDASSGATKAYVDGNFQQQVKSEAGVVTKPFSSIGRIENTSSGKSPKYLQGSLDEVKVFSGVLSNGDVSSIFTNENAGKNWDGTARVCAAAGPDHYELSLPAASITCLPTTVIVTACADSSNPCASVATGVTGTANLAVTGGTIGVVALTAGVGATTLSYPAATDGTGVTVSLTSATTPATYLTTCSGGSCSTTFNTAGFIFSAAANGAAATVPTQVAGVVSGAYYLRAVKANATTMACQTALTGTQSVDLGYECNDPATCYAADLMSVNAGTATLIARNNNGAHSSATPVNMTFDANGNAPFTFVYSDVGKVTLWARKTVNSAVLTGSSLPAGGFVVKPYDFGVMPCAASVVGDCTTPPADPGLTGGGSVFAKAGQSFKATVTARAFGGTATPSFGSGSNNATETVSLTHTRVAPTSVGAVDGSLGGTTSILRSSFGNGISTIGNLSWSEVGVITLTATNSTFLGNALTTTGTTGNLGRFIPDHFDTVVAGPMSCAPGAGCAAPITEMVYSGQVFKTVTVLAKNATNAQTSNYQGAFAKAVTLSATAASGGAAIPTGGTGQPTFTPASASGFTAGKAILTGAAAPVFAFATSPTVPTDVYVRAIDADSVSSLRSPATSSVEGGVKVVSGRIKIPNVYGSELLPLPITVSVQYYKNASEAWVLSTTDSVTRFDTSIDIEASIVKGPLAAVTVQSPGLVTVGSGVKTFTFNKPNVAGSADICLKNPSWLMTNGGLVCGVSPRMFGRATFGIYKSPLIYRRENY